jgi:hypothetical protein
VVDEQVALYGTLTGRPARADSRPRRAAPARPASEAADEGGRVVELRRRSARDR